MRIPNVSSTYICLNCFLMSIAKQIIPTYINHSRPLIQDGIHLFFERGLRWEQSQTCPYMLSAKQDNIWNHFDNLFSMTRSGIEPTTSRSRGKRSNHWTTAQQTYGQHHWHVFSRWYLLPTVFGVSLWRRGPTFMLFRACNIV